MGCCSFPQGRRAVHAMLWSIFSYLFCASATTGCYFMKIDGYLLPGSPFFVLQDVGSSTIGLFGYEELGSDSNGGLVCLSYSAQQLDALLDGPWKTARIFGILANALAGVTMLYMIFASCISYSTNVLKMIAGMAFTGSVCVLLTFIMFASKLTDEPHNGRFYVGGGMAIIAFLCAVMTGLLILQIGPPAVSNYTVTPPPTTTGGNNRNNTTTTAPPPPPRRHFPAPPKKQKATDAPPEAAAQPDDPYQPGTETVTETVLPDGTRKIVTTKIDLDGSRSVTETIIQQS